MTEQQLPKGWQMVKFGDIAKHISKRVEPSETDLEIYVGLEHLDSDSLKIKRHGVPSDVEGQKLLVEKGQVIFGKRRAYLRKVAVADWDCICSAHAMVLEANPENVIPDFLPFFMQSDVFMNRAVAISEGSLSPTIKWKALGNQKFLIPNVELQRKIIFELMSLENILSKTESLLYSAEMLKLSLAYNFFSLDECMLEQKESYTTTIGEICTSYSGGTPSTKVKEYYDGDIPWITSTLVNNRKIISTDEFISESGLKHSSAKLIKKNMILVAMYGATAGKVAINKVETAAINQAILALKPNKDISHHYFFHLMEFIMKKAMTLVQGGQPNFSAKIIKELKVKIHEQNIQKIIGRQLDICDDYIDALKQKKLNLSYIKNHYIYNQIED